MERLTYEVSPFLSRPTYQVILVFDGGSESNRPQVFQPNRQLMIINSLKNQPADLLIEVLVKRLLRQSRGMSTISVVTDDHSLRSMVQTFGGQYLSVRQFNGELRRLQSIQSEQQMLRQRNGAWNPTLGDLFN